jgi:hypothetical protein
MLRHSGLGGYGVYPHAENRSVTDRGYVVRRCDANGWALDAFNYGGILPVDTYVRESDAQRRADVLNREG